jgi:CDP-glucose 4,6-dehydratase
MQYSLGQRLRELPGPLLLTGHTGFKGTWLTFLLDHIQVPVVGYSLEAEKNSLFARANRIGSIPEVFADIREYEALEHFIDSQKPCTIIHMAAQPLVLRSYEKPRETFDVNVMGTANLLDISFKKNFIKSIVIVTTDKVYKNESSGRAFIETDALEGKDPYSASKVGTEAVVAAWQQIANLSGGPKVVSVRAGNVIGGGDFAENRIIPDLIRGVMSGNLVEIRNPDSTRPWQHVLDPLIGYIRTLENSLGRLENLQLNFGPVGKNLSVLELTQIANSVFKDLKLNILQDEAKQNYEAKMLELNSDLAKNTLGWEPKWPQEVAIYKTFKWWSSYLNNLGSADELCKQEVTEFMLTKKHI